MQNNLLKKYLYDSIFSFNEIIPPIEDTIWFTVIFDCFEKSDPFDLCERPNLIEHFIFMKETKCLNIYKLINIRIHTYNFNINKIYRLSNFRTNKKILNTSKVKEEIIDGDILYLN